MLFLERIFYSPGSLWTSSYFLCIPRSRVAGLFPLSWLPLPFSHLSCFLNPLAPLWWFVCLFVLSAFTVLVLEEGLHICSGSFHRLLSGTGLLCTSGHSVCHFKPHRFSFPTTSHSWFGDVPPYFAAIFLVCPSVFSFRYHRWILRKFGGCSLLF